MDAAEYVILADTLGREAARVALDLSDAIFRVGLQIHEEAA